MHRKRKKRIEGLKKILWTEIGRESCSFFVDLQWNIEYIDDALFLCRANRPLSNDAYDPDGLVIRTGPKRLAKSGLFSIVHLSVHVESASRIHLDEQMVSSHDPLPYLSGLTQQCLINRFLPPILLLLYATSQFQDARIDPFFSFFFFFPRMKKIYELSIPNRTIIFHFLSIFASNFLYLYFTLKSIVQMFPKYPYSTIVYIYLSRSPHICFFLPSNSSFFRTIPISKETTPYTYHITVGRIGKFPRARNRARYVERSVEFCPVHRSSPSLLRGASRVNTVTILISCAMAGCP